MDSGMKSSMFLKLCRKLVVGGHSLGGIQTDNPMYNNSAPTSLGDAQLRIIFTRAKPKVTVWHLLEMFQSPGSICQSPTNLKAVKLQMLRGFLCGAVGLGSRALRRVGANVWIFRLNREV